MSKLFYIVAGLALILVGCQIQQQTRQMQSKLVPQLMPQTVIAPNTNITRIPLTNGCELVVWKGKTNEWCPPPPMTNITLAWTAPTIQGWDTARQCRTNLMATIYESQDLKTWSYLTNTEGTSITLAISKPRNFYRVIY